MDRKLDISIVVVTYNCGGFIERFISGLISSLKPYFQYEILIADNASTDKTVSIIEAFENITLTRLEKNIGFSKANNCLISSARYPNILLLNPDVFGFTPAFWEQLLEQWDYQNPMFIKLMNMDGSFQDCIGQVASIKRFITNLLKRVDYSAIQTPTQVEMGIMAFMLATRSIFDEVGLISEDYYMYGEDMDWCYRATLKKYRVIYNPQLSLYHIGGASAKERWKQKDSKRLKYLSEKKFIKKHYSGLNKLFMLLLNNIKLLKTSNPILTERSITKRF